MLQTVRIWKRLKAVSENLAIAQARGFMRGAIASLLVLMVLGVTACGGSGRLSDTSTRTIQRMSEVSPPSVVQSLVSINDGRPIVSIVSPRPDTVIDNDDVSIRFRVKDLDVYQDDDLGLGPHLNILVDNDFYGALYDTTAPIELVGLTPGTHTIRAIAASAWDESFKNPEAYAQTTFHVFTKTPLTAPPDGVPLLTYSQPANSYGAEPILLDYFFTPGTVDQELSALPIEEGQDSITQGWQVRATINGESFTFDQWEPIYLKGFKPGKNWVQLELLDDQQQPIESLFNNTARIIQYEPGGDDTLSRLMRDELTLEEVGTLVDPNYAPPIEVTEPDITEPDITEPNITEPEITEPEITESEITEPEITEPEIAEPDITELEITEPEITEQEITEPDITEPEITEPEITEPEITEPAKESAYIDEDNATKDEAAIINNESILEESQAEDVAVEDDATAAETVTEGPLNEPETLTQEDAVDTAEELSSDATLEPDTVR